jgi:hypothetical protein
MQLEALLSSAPLWHYNLVLTAEQGLAVFCLS